MENEEVINNPSWINETWQKVLDILNQPFMIAIICVLLLGLILIILFRGGSYGKKKYNEVNKKVDLVEYHESDYEKGLDKKFNEKSEELENRYKDFATYIYHLCKDNKDKISIICNSLSHINNVKVQKELESIENGEEAENN